VPQPRYLALQRRSSNRLIERDPALRLPQAVDVYERAISLNVMSKAYGLADSGSGGWLARIAQRSSGSSITSISYRYATSAPSEMAGANRAPSRHKILDRNRKVVRDNLVILNTFFVPIY